MVYSRSERTCVHRYITLFSTNNYIVSEDSPSSTSASVPMGGKLKIVLLGASGQTGQPLLRLCLEGGHQVVAVVRSRTTDLRVEHHNLRREEADIFSSESLTPIFRGQDVVISALGFPKQAEEKMTKFTESMAAVLEAMRRAGLRRIITMSAWYTDPATRAGQVMFDTMWTKVPGLVNTRMVTFDTFFLLHVKLDVSIYIMNT